MPCKPYSQQRAKRFANDSIKNHADHYLTEEALIQWLAETCPEAGFFENVEGWDMPVKKGDGPHETPLRRRGFESHCIHIDWAV